MELSDEELLTRYRTVDDREAMAELYRRHVDAAWRLARHLAGNEADASDAVQTAFLHLLRDAQAYHYGNVVKSWILGIVANSVRQQARATSRRRRREALMDPPVEPSPIMESDTRARINGAVERLPLAIREVIWMHFREGLGSVAIAQGLKRPERTVRWQLERGLQLLRRTLAPVEALSLAAVLSSPQLPHPGPGGIPTASAPHLHLAPERLSRILSEVAHGPMPATPMPAWLASGGGLARLAGGIVAIGVTMALGVMGSLKWVVPVHPQARGLAAEFPPAVTADTPLELHLLRSWRGHHDMVRSVAYSPDGTILFSAGNDGTLRGWDRIRTSKPIEVALGAGMLTSIAVAPEGGLVAVTAEDGSIWLWERGSGATRRIGSHTGIAWQSAYTPQGVLASTGDDERIDLWDAGGHLRRQLIGHRDVIHGLVFTSAGERLWSSSNDGMLCCWEVNSGRLIVERHAHEGMAYALVVTADGTTLASGGVDGVVHLWDARDGRCMSTADAKPIPVPGTGVVQSYGLIIALAFDHSGHRLAVVHQDRSIEIVDPATGRRWAIIPDGALGADAVSFSPDDAALATAGADGCVREYGVPRMSP